MSDLKQAIGISVWGKAGGIGNATGYIISDNNVLVAGMNNGVGRVDFLFSCPPVNYKWGGNLTLQAPGYKDYTQRISMESGNYDVEMQPSFPDKPTRDEVCALQTSFQFLYIDTEQYGRIPSYDVAISSLNPADRQRQYAAKKAAGDTHCLICLSWNYQETTYSYPVPGRDLSKDLNTFCDLVAEIRQNGFIPVLELAGDGDSVMKDGKPTGEYNDPAGWTYGREWLMEKLPEILSALHNYPTANLIEHCLISPGFDGIFYGWTDPNGVEDYGKFVRAIEPNAYLKIEHSAGNIPLGEGGTDYLPGGRMMLFDVLASEFAVWPTTGDTIWQIGARLLGPDYVRPSDQPPDDDPGSPFDYGNPKFYVQFDTPRGPIYRIAFEPGTYGFVRGWYTDADAINCGQYYKRVGWKYICVPNWARV